MPDTWRYVERARPEHWYDMHVSTRYWIQTMPWVSAAASGGSTISLGGGSFSVATDGVAARTSLALCATAFVANSNTPAAAATSRRRSWLICSEVSILRIGESPRLAG